MLNGTLTLKNYSWRFGCKRPKTSGLEKVKSLQIIEWRKLPLCKDTLLYTRICMGTAMTLQHFYSNHLAWLLRLQYFFSVKYFYPNSSFQTCFVNHTKRSSAQLFPVLYLPWKEFPLVKWDNFANRTCWSVEDGKKFSHQNMYSWYHELVWDSILLSYLNYSSRV